MDVLQHGIAECLGYSLFQLSNILGVVAIVGVALVHFDGQREALTIFFSQLLNGPETLEITVYLRFRGCLLARIG